MARILITSGPTRQYLDPVRYLTNASSGRMGRALAEALQLCSTMVRASLLPILAILSAAACGPCDRIKRLQGRSSRVQ